MVFMKKENLLQNEIALLNTIDTIEINIVYYMTLVLSLMHTFNIYTYVIDSFIEHNSRENFPVRIFIRYITQCRLVLSNYHRSLVDYVN